MKYGTASKKTYDQQSSKPACASAQFKQDLCNRKKKKKKKNHVKLFCLAPTHSSTGPAYDFFFFFLNTRTRYARSIAWAYKDTKK